MIRTSILHIFIFTATSFLFTSNLAHAQTIQWQRALGGTGDESCMAVVPAHDSGYIISGMTSSVNGDVTANHGGGDFWAVRLSNSGNIMWQKTYGGSGHDYGSRVTPTADGGYIMVGGTLSSDGDITSTHGAMDVWAVKLDGNGNMQWQKTYGGSGNDFGNDIQQTFEGGYIISGYTSSPNDGDVTGFHGGNLDCWVVKINDTGAITWARAYGGTGEDGAIVIRQLADSSYIFGGYTMSLNGDVSNYHGGTSDGGDAWVVKIGKTGIIKWQKAYGGSYEEQVFDMELAANNNYIIGTSTRSYNGDVANPIGHVDGWVFRIDDTGKILWQKNYGTGESEHLTGICRTPDNGFIFTGWTEDLWLGKIDSMGTLQWQKEFGGTGWEAGWGICMGNDGGYVIAGNTYSTDHDVTGFHGGPNDIWALKVAAPSGISVLNNNTPTIKVYPNPATQLLNIEGIESNSSVTLYNASGQAVKSWILKQGSATLHISELPAGIYQLQLVNSNGEQQYEKIVKLY